MSTISILIVDDSATVRAMLEQVLGHEHDFRLVGTAADAASAFRMIREHNPDVTTIDIAMPGADGFALLDEVHDCTHAVMLSSLLGAKAESFDRGAVGFFNKSEILSDSKKLVEMVRTAAQGRITRLAA